MSDANPSKNNPAKPDAAGANETPASGDKDMWRLKNPSTGSVDNYDPKTAQIQIDRKGFEKVGIVKQKDTSLAAVVTDKNKK